MWIPVSWECTAGVTGTTLHSPFYFREVFLPCTIFSPLETEEREGAEMTLLVSLMKYKHSESVCQGAC